LIITIYDIKHKIIPNEWVYTFSALAFIKLFFTPDLSFMIPSIIDLLAGPILALPFLLMSIVSSGKWMGYADSKLVLGIGWTVGLISGLSAVILAFWIGAIVGISIMYAKHGRYKSKYEIPFGPYLILGMYVVLFTGIRVLEL
jgi:leader peptidase (prepilin peptidase)/N-methyltransferase